MSELKLSQFKAFNLVDQKLLKTKFEKYQPQASEYCFSYFFSWQNYYGYKWTIYKDWLLILSQEKNKPTCFLQPIGTESRAAITLELLKWLKEQNPDSNPFINRADERLVSELQNSSKFKIEEKRDYFDYIYNLQDLATLKGRKYHSKRNHINKFNSRYSYSYENINADNIPACRAIEQKWCKLKDCDKDESKQAERKALFRTLDNYKDLALIGGIISVEGDYEAFSIGEMLNDNMVVVHYEKADPEISGLYQFINKKFCDNIDSDIQHVNREQDLGISGIRKAKQSYHPSHFAKKYKITLK